MSGKVWGADERVSVEDAIRAYTVNSAYINFDEKQKGTLEVGKLADIVVLGDELLTIDPNRLKDARIDMTIVGGKVLYDRRSGVGSDQRERLIGWRGGCLTAIRTLPLQSDLSRRREAPTWWSNC